MANTSSVTQLAHEHNTAEKAGSARRGLCFALVLGLLAPLVGEFLLGNKPITAIAGLILLAPLYGGAAILIREVSRRHGGGWFMIILLSMAYGLLLEGILDQMIFNPAYLKLESFDGWARIPGFNASASLIQGSLTLHTIWSMCLPILLIELFDKRPGNKPWLSRRGLKVTAAVFALAAVATILIHYDEFKFMASPAQLGVIVCAVMALCVAAFKLKPRITPAHGHTAPTPRKVARRTFMALSLYWVAWIFMVGGEAGLEWFNVVFWLIWASAVTLVSLRWMRSDGWGDRHRLALARGALLTYVWVGFFQAGVVYGLNPIVVLGNVVFGAGAIILLRAAAHRHHSPC